MRKPSAKGDGSVGWACSDAAGFAFSLADADCAVGFDSVLEATGAGGDFGAAGGAEAQPYAQQTRETLMAVRTMFFIRSTVVARWVGATLLPLQYGAGFPGFSSKRRMPTVRVHLALTDLASHFERPDAVAAKFPGRREAGILLQSDGRPCVRRCIAGRRSEMVENGTLSRR